MPWKEATTMSERSEFIKQAKEQGANISGICWLFGISRKTGYKWLKREREGGESGLENRSRRPHCSPRQTEGRVETQVLEVRKK